VVTCCGFQLGFRGTHGFSERQPEIPSVATKNIKITAESFRNA